MPAAVAGVQDFTEDIMGHHHSHGGHHHHHHHDTGNIKFAFFLNLGFALLELVGGIFVNSVSVIADALHDFGDALSLGASYFLQRKSDQQRDSKYTYGYKRYSVAAALLTSVVLLGGSVFMLMEAAERFRDPVLPDADGMLVLAIIGILVNGAAFFRLKKGSTLNERAVSFHMLEDLMGWVAVLVVSIVLQFANLLWLDPLLSVAIALFIGWNAFKNGWASLKLLLQEKPENLDLEELQQQILKVPAISAVHGLQAWSLDGEHHVLTAHLVVPPNTDLNDWRLIKELVKDKLQPFGIVYTTLELEHAEEECVLID